MARPTVDTNQRVDARRNRDNLATVARTVFVEQGTDASLRDIARRAGVGIGTLYRHFPTREALVEAALQGGFDTLRALADELMTEPSPRKALVTWMRRFFTISGACRGLPSSLLAGLNDQKSDLHASSEAMRQAAAPLLARAQEAGEVRQDMSATDLIAMTVAAAWVAQATGTEQATGILTVLIDGLASANDQPKPPSLSG